MQGHPCRPPSSLASNFMKPGSNVQSWSTNLNISNRAAAVW
jgi:hypothetical protein